MAAAKEIVLTFELESAGRGFRIHSHAADWIDCHVASTSCGVVIVLPVHRLYAKRRRRRCNETRPAVYQ
jgi:hypothetical protein